LSEGGLLFLAHARADAQLVGDIEDLASAAGFRLWTDLVEGTTVESAHIALARTIACCAVFAVLLTRQSVLRPWVQWEVRYAVSINKAPLIPILYETDEAALPSPFDRLIKCNPVPLRPASSLGKRLLAIQSSTVAGPWDQARTEGIQRDGLLILDVRAQVSAHG